MVVHTLGHSTHTLEEFVGLLAAHRLTGVVDVRRFPASRRHPHFARDALRAALATAGCTYAWVPALGGRRTGRPDSPHTGWRVAAFRAYADHLESAEFADGMVALLALAAARPTAIMCAEAVPWRCHRQLIADALLARDVEVRHVLGPTETRPHRLPAFARLEGERVIYDGGQGSLLRPR